MITLRIRSALIPILLVIASLFSPAYQPSYGTTSIASTVTSSIPEWFGGRLAIYENGPYRADFLAPNELNPENQLPILENAPQGIHISVGTERGFIGAAMNPSSTGLILVDRDAAVVRYNAINIALLELAENRAEYVDLRLNLDHSHWQELAEARYRDGRLSEFAHKILTAQEHYLFFRETIRKVNSTFYFLHKNGKERTHFVKAHSYFNNSNYLYDEVLFNKLSFLAKNQRMIALEVDLGQPEGENFKKLFE